MTVVLLDASVLIALVVADHEHHDAASSWVEAHRDVAVCPITEGALVRFLVRVGVPGADARSAVAQVAARPGTEFWPDAVSYADVSLDHVLGHGQVTDAYLAGLARARGARLATLDAGLAAAAADVAVLIPR
ncbi:TA system VapC family ribonuclease toxin [Klenkia sp. LSe6-5]|uniref:Ribonuclease VapC n=1 Tax=Klenkia sesuvii TaxID=3103137 RepID=A0ABU8DRX7_9ACTN